MPIAYQDTKSIPQDQVLTLYRANQWSSADKPQKLCEGLRNSHRLVSAWDADRLVGLANSLSDGCLVVYYSHVLIHPEYRRRGIGRELMTRLMSHYQDFHQQVLIADGDAVEFFRSLGFGPAGETRSMWIFAGREHA